MPCQPDIRVVITAPVEHCTSSALAELTDLARRELWPDVFRFCDAFRRCDVMHLALIDQRPIGFVVASDDVPEVHGLFVHPDFRRRGVARRLLQHLADLRSVSLSQLSAEAVTPEGRAVIQALGLTHLSSWSRRATHGVAPS